MSYVVRIERHNVKDHAGRPIPLKEAWVQRSAGISGGTFFITPNKDHAERFRTKEEAESAAVLVSANYGSIVGHVHVEEA